VRARITVTVTTRAPDQDGPRTPRELIGEVSRLCPEALELFLVAGDGVIVERSRGEDSSIDADELAVEVIGAVPLLAGLAAASRVGGFQEWTLHGDRGTLIVRRIPLGDMFLVLCVPPGTWTGKARFAARVISGRLASALA
jgi:hypothetical protein